jgi:hypothetical protein
MALADAEDLGATNRADILSCRLAILHGYDLGISHFPLGPALNTVSLHPDSPFTQYLQSRVANLTLLVNRELCPTQ